MSLDQAWVAAIADYLASQRAAGYPVSTQNTRQQHLQYLARRISPGPWEVSADELVEWAAAQPWSPSTRRSRRTTIQSFYRWAKSAGRIKQNPSKALERVKQPRPHPRPIPQRLYLEALLQASALERLWMELAYDHGLRRAEIACIHSSDLTEDLLGRSLIVHGKGGHERTVPLTPRVAQALEARGEGWLCSGDDGGHISPRWLGKRVNRLLPGAWTIHSLRHAAGTKWNREGGLLVAQKLLGHASVATTQVYCAVPDESLRATVLATAS